jgi:signal transduction histidine kinase
MLRNAGVRWKILAVLVLPVVVLVLAAGLISGGAFADARAAGRARQLAQAGDVGPVIGALQSERVVTARSAGDPAMTRQLAALRRNTDEAAAELRSRIVAADLNDLTKQARDSVLAADAANHSLAELRKLVDSGQAGGAVIGYTRVITADLLVPTAIADGLSQRDAANNLAAFAALERASEGAAREQLTGFDVARSGTATSAQQAEIGLASGQRESALDDFAAKASPAQAARLAGQEKAAKDFSDGHAALVGIAAPTDANAWSATVTRYIGALRAVSDTVAADAATEAGDQASSQQWRAVLTLLAALALLAASVAFALYQVRRIVEPLKHLTRIATELRQDLPAMVERIASGEPRPELPKVDVEGEDEIGQLAAAFRDVNSTAIEVAGQQVALRAGVAETFINVARRNQVLLSRQLTFIDELERTEENPEILDNLFKLDHLATRMRRNAESLLVLAGIEAAPRMRKPMPLSDVIRTAISEIEHYDRVSLSVDADPPVMAHLSLSAAHLLAELVENATAFSDPDSVVEVEAIESTEGIRVTVRDSGIGMTTDELAEANLKLTSVPTANALGSQRLGFYVVGQLANKLNATVVLTRGGESGVLATVEFPPSLFVPGSLEHLPTRPAEGSPEAAAEAPAPPVETRIQSFPNTDTTLNELRGSIGGQLADVDAAEMPAFGHADAAEKGLPRRGGKPAATPAPAAVTPPPAFPAFDDDETPWTPEQAPVARSAPSAASTSAIPEAWAEDRSTDYTGAPESDAGGQSGSQVATVVDVLPTKGGSRKRNKGSRSAPPSQRRQQQPAPAGPAAPQAPADGDLEAQLNRSSLASQALSELSQLSTYAPAEVAATPATAPLTRRRPGGGAASAPPQPPGGLGQPGGLSFEDQESANRARTAAQVRSMLAGFQAGVSRGRTTETEPSSSAGAPPS